MSGERTAERGGSAGPPMPVTQNSKLKTQNFVLIAILALAVAARYVGLWQGLPFDYHYDERIYFHESLFALANGMRREAAVSANAPYLLILIMLLNSDWLALTQGVTTFAA